MKTRATLDLLRRYESRNITYQDPAGGWPIVWDRAKGVHVWDLEGRRYLDFTAAFGVAAAGHANPRVVRAGQAQMAKLLHAMGDVHPHALKAELARELSRRTFERWSAGGKTAEAVTGKTIFCSSGFEAVEAALKTAFLATGRRGLLAFEGGYHGLGYGALNATHRSHFRAPFQRQLARFGEFVPFPSTPSAARQTSQLVRQRLATGRIGAVLLEPIQARGGIRVPPDGFLTQLQRVCAKAGALLILDEIYTGFGRTGTWFAAERDRVMPDLICLGKALGGGFPLSACVGRAPVMDSAWPESDGEAIHTSTFLGHPVGCAMALAHLREIERADLIAASAATGDALMRMLQAIEVPRGFKAHVRGRGLMIGLELTHRDGTAASALVLGVVKEMLHRGFILLPEGADANVIGFTPPLTVTVAQCGKMVQALKKVIGSVADRL